MNTELFIWSAMTGLISYRQDIITDPRFQAMDMHHARDEAVLHQYPSPGGTDRQRLDVSANKESEYARHCSYPPVDPSSSTAS